MFSAQEHFNFQEPSSEDETVRNRKKKQRTRHSQGQLDSNSPADVAKELEHENQKKENHNTPQDQTVSTAETFNSNPASVASNSSPVIIEEKQPEEQKLDFKIHVNPYNSVLTPEEIKNLTIEDARYYKILGESRMFHARPGLHSQKIKEIEQLQKEKVEKDNNRLKNQQLQEMAQKQKQLKMQSTGQEDVAGTAAGNVIDNEGDFSDLFAVDLQNRYFISEEKQQVQCRRCKQSGHFERMCVQDIKNLCTCCLGDHPAYACTQRVCFNCNNSGHFNKNCPFQKFTRCARCQKLGHHKADCGAILLHTASSFPGSASSYSGNNWPKNFKTVEEDWKKYDDQKVKCISCGRKGHIACKDYGAEKVRDEVYGRQFQERMRKHREKEENKKFEENRKQIFQGSIVNFVYDETEDEENDQEDEKKKEEEAVVQEVNKQTKKLKKLKEKKEKKEVVMISEDEEEEIEKVIGKGNGEKESVSSSKVNKAAKKIDLRSKEDEEEEEEDIQIHVVKKEKEQQAKKKEKKIKKAKENQASMDVEIEDIEQQAGKKKKLNRKQRREQLQLAAKNYGKVSKNNNNNHLEDISQDDDEDDDVDLDTMLARNMLQKKIIKNRHLEQETEYHDFQQHAESGENYEEDLQYLLDGQSRSGYGSDICLSEVESESGNTHNKQMYSQHDRGSKLKLKRAQEKSNARNEASRSRSRSKKNSKNTKVQKEETTTNTKNKKPAMNKQKQPQSANNENVANPHYLRHPVQTMSNDFYRLPRDNVVKNKQNHPRSNSHSNPPHVSKDRNIFNQQTTKQQQQQMPKQAAKKQRNDRSNSKNRKNTPQAKQTNNNDRYFSFEKQRDVKQNNNTLRSRPRPKKKTA